MKKSILTIASVALGLTACGGSGGGSKSDGGARATVTSLDFKPLKGPKLTDKQMQQFREYGKRMNQTNLDELLFTPSDESAEDRATRTEKTSKLSSPVARLLQQAKQHCDIAQPEKREEGALTAIGSTKTETRQGSINGARCPIDAQRSSTQKMTLLDYNPKAQVATFSIVSTVDQEYHVRDAAAAADTNVTRSKLNMTMEGNLTSSTATGESRSTGLVTGKGGGEFVDGKGVRATIDFDIQVLNDEARNSTDTIVYMKLVMNNTPYNISVHTTGELKNSSARTTETYLNGEKIDSLDFVKFDPK